MMVMLQLTLNMEVDPTPHIPTFLNVPMPVVKHMVERGAQVHPGGTDWLDELFETADNLASFSFCFWWF
jgi:hypothetical protein